MAIGKANGWASRPAQVGMHRTAGSATLSTRGYWATMYIRRAHRNATVNTPLNVAKVLLYNLELVIGCRRVYMAKRMSR
jgi:hypothetical protein